MRFFTFILLVNLAACKESKDSPVAKQSTGEVLPKVAKISQSQTASNLLPSHMNPVEAYSKLCSKAGYTVTKESKYF